MRQQLFEDILKDVRRMLDSALACTTIPPTVIIVKRAEAEELVRRIEEAVRRD